MKEVLIAIAFGAAVGLTAREQTVPRELSRLARDAGLVSPILAWCQGEFRPDESGAFAVGVTSPGGGGRYLILGADAATFELGAFKRTPDVSCHTPAEATSLNEMIGQSQTIHGRVTPRWRTAVVCAFVDDTTAMCWQYSPIELTFVEVGGWIT
jgi:hypothetical protein